MNRVSVIVRKVVIIRVSYNRMWLVGRLVVSVLIWVGFGCVLDWLIVLSCFIILLRCCRLLLLISISSNVLRNRLVISCGSSEVSRFSVWFLYRFCSRCVGCVLWLRLIL